MSTLPKHEIFKVMNFPALEYYVWGEGYYATEAIYLLPGNKVICKNSQISAPKIFLKSPDVLHTQNCNIEGKVIYLSDSDTCTLYKDDPLVAAHCPYHSDL